jgi:hypothetical protein
MARSLAPKTRRSDPLERRPLTLARSHNAGCVIDTEPLDQRADQRHGEFRMRHRRVGKRGPKLDVHIGDAEFLRDLRARSEAHLMRPEASNSAQAWSGSSRKARSAE